MWMSELDKNYLQRINLPQLDSAETNLFPKIRIAVLDTGVDPTDAMIRGAMSTARIMSQRSWAEYLNDIDGHGTHVTQILLKTAPAAEIYVAKISDEKSVERKDISRIAQVSLTSSEGFRDNSC
jgi:hypothetical protein